MNSYIIKGGKKLRGSVVINPSKNSAVAVLVASILNEKKTIIADLPRIEEVLRIIEVLNSIGIKTKWVKRSLEIIPPKKINLNSINIEAAKKTRSIILFLGALAHKFKSFSLPNSGGCKIGKRTIMPHIYALENFGIKIKKTKGALKVDCKNISSAEEIVMYESGDTATENTILVASMISAKTVIKLASANYQVQDLCCFLKKLGVKIEGIGTTTLIIHGKKKLSKSIRYNLIEDPIEAMFFLAVAIMTTSSIVMKRCPIEFLELELLKLKKMGFKFNILKRYLAKNGFSKLVDIKTFPSKLSAPAEKISARPFPGLNIDNLPFFVPIATQAKGETLIHDWVFEDRAIYYTELNRLGANVRLVDPHRVFIKGPTRMRPAEVICPPALRPSAIILVSMLAAKGESILRNIYSIDRGYEDISERLKKLGANIELDNL